MDAQLLRLSKECVNSLQRQNKKIAFAESCTGGLLAKSLTEHSGCSSVFECGVVSYSGRIKHLMLNVDKDLIAQYGEVSEQVAIAMADGIRRCAASDIGVGITGIAGPTGATDDKKVGLIYVSVSDSQRTKAFKLEYYNESLSRSERRKMTACFAFEQVLRLLSK